MGVFVSWPRSSSPFSEEDLAPECIVAALFSSEELARECIVAIPVGLQAVHVTVIVHNGLFSFEVALECIMAVLVVDSFNGLHN